MLRFTLLTLLLITIFTGDIYAQNSTSPIGDWKGAIVIPPQQLIILTHFEKKDSTLIGTIDIPQQLANGIKLKAIRIHADSLHFGFHTGMSDITFDGTFINPDSIYGAFRQAGNAYPFYLNRQIAKASAFENRSYTQKNVILRHDSLKIGGTLVLPKNHLPAPVVIFISGSGAQNRDENIFGFKPFAILADSLANHGIGSFRYDDRGVGESTGSLSAATLQDLSSDVQVIFRYLTKQPGIRPDKIGLLGHSEGAIVAGHVGVLNPGIAFVVLMAGPAYPLNEIILQQIQMISKGMGMSKSRIDQNIKLERQIFRALQTGHGMDQVKGEMVDRELVNLHKLPKKQQEQVGDLKVYARKEVNTQLAPLNMPSLKSFLFYDPGKDLKNIHIPVLALFGQLDHQVPADTNLSRMNNIFGNKKSIYHSTIIDSANHLFQKAYTGLPNEYATLKPQFVAGLTDTLITWIEQRK